REVCYVALVPRHVVSKNRAGCVSKAQTFTVICNPVTVRNANARGGAVLGEQNVVRPIDLSQIGKLAVVCTDDSRIKLQLLGRIGDLTITEAFPSQSRDRTCAEHGPHGHFKCTGVRTRYNTDMMRVGQIQQLAHQVDAISEASLANLGAVRAAKRFSCKLFEGPARSLSARAGREKRTRRCGLRFNKFSHLRLSSQR